MRRIRFCLIVLLLSLLFSPIMTEASEGSLERDLQGYLGQSKAILEQLGEKFQSGSPITDQLTNLGSVVEEIKASHLLMMEQFRLREEKVSAHGAKALERHRAMSEEYRKSLEEYLSLLEDFLRERNVTLTALDRLKAILDRILYVKKKPIFGSLPYRNLNYPSREPSSDPPIKPAYKGGNKIVAPEDLKSTAEAPITEGIANLAQSLNWNPVSIYEWVKNNIETEWYWGSMKGAEETLSQRSGNDCDQASLLIALLRASGFPSRYVRGVIEFFPDIEKAKNLTGISDPTKIAEFFQKAGVPFKPIIAGGRISNFQIEHIWVETEVPYANYRGAPLDQYGKTWLGLDTSIKVTGYTYNTPIDILQEFSLSNMRDEYLNAVQTQTPLGYLRSTIDSYLATRNSQPGNPQPGTYGDLLRTKTLIQEVMNILPASMQYQQVKTTQEYTELPDELKHRVRFTARNPQLGTDSPELFSMELDTLHLSNQKVALSYEPETVEDQEIVNSYGGLDNTPAYLIRLRPVLGINGERMVVGRDGLPMGADYNLTIELRVPGYELTSSEKIANTMIVGNLSVIGIVAQKTIPVMDNPQPETRDAEQLLFEEAIKYIDRWNKAEEELASLFQLVITRPISTVVTLGGVIDVTYLLDTPHEFNWKGVFVDANLKTIETVASSGVRVTGESQKTFMQLSALQGSILEDRIFEDDFQVESISTAKLFGLARNTQPATEILTIDKSNIDTILPSLPFDQNIKEDIKNSVNQNLTIRIPQSAIQYEDWTGIGYLKEDPSTGESGYMLTGMIAGGMTAWGIDKWPAYYADTLSNSNSEPPNEDPASATSIQKITKTDLQKGKVGQPLQQPLQVIVRDKKGKPVSKVEVTFTVKAGGGRFSDASTAFKATTGGDGIASARFTLGQKTSDNPTFVREEGSTQDNAQQVGENIVEASLKSGTKITKPFTAYGFPGDATRINQTRGDGWLGPILSFAGFVSVIVVDQYENPISNLPVNFSVLPALDKSSCPNPNQDVRQAVLVKRDDPCLMGSPTLGQCASAAPSLVEKTDSKGALAQVILGSIPQGEYPITAESGSLSTTFRLYTNGFGNCSGTQDPSVEFSLDYVYISDSYGNNITAGKVDTEIPVQAKIYFLKEGETEKEITINCNEGPLTCKKIVGDRKYSIVTDFLSSSVTFAGKGGVDQGGGIYASTYKLQSGYNRIKVEGKATTDYRWTEMACPATCNPQSKELEQSDYRTIGVYGVDVQLDPTPIIVGDDKGYAVKDFLITYTITPAQYRALTAFLFLYKDGELIATIPTEVSDKGTATIARGFQFDVNSKYQVEVVLNPGTGVEIRSGRQDLKFGIIYIEEEDPEYPDVKLRWDDYYPALGSKVITIINPGNSLKDRVVKCEILDTTDEEIAQIKPPVTPPACERVDEKITDGKMRFKLTGTALAPQINDDPSTGIDEIALGFYLEEEGKENYDIVAYYNVKNNFNTTFGEVLAGEAVFVYDDNGDDNHIGKTGEDVTIDDDKKSDFVQELLNQVVPRKRSVGQNYQLLESNGVYNDPVMEAVRLFRTNFGFASPSRTFEKIKKDYSNPTINEAVWLNKIVEKDVLVGKTFNPQDKLINGESGLFELYKNVVGPFITNLINEANRYANATGFNNSQSHWKPRTYPSDPAQTIGMSYCFGCKNSISAYNNMVTHCQVEDTPTIKSHETDGPDNGNEYRGNIRETDCGIGGGDKRWPGLYSSISGYEEYDLYARCILNNDPNCTNTERLESRAFNPSLWAGIDCSGLVQRAVEEGRSTATGIDITIPSPDDWINSQQFFTNSRVFYLLNPIDSEQRRILHGKLRKGDLVRYSGHISTLYSERPNCSGTSCSYQIIHAYGATPYQPIDEFGRNIGSPIFSRKVLITRQNIGLVPIGFGRIKLW